MIIKNFDISKLELESHWESKLLGNTILFFIAPKEWIADKYPEADSAEISCGFTTIKPIDGLISVMISPTKNGNVYNWDNLELDNKTIKELIKIGLERKEQNDA